MPLRARRLTLLVPPLVVAAAVVLLLARPGGRSGQTLRESVIAARWDSPEEFEAVARDVEAYDRDFGAEPAARWFAAEAWAHLGRYAKAVDTARGRIAAPLSSADARRLAMLLLSRIGRLTGSPQSHSLYYPRTLEARIAAGEPGAREELEAAIASMSLSEMAPLFKQFQRSQTPATRALADALLSRSKDREFEIAGATLVTGPRDRSHIDLLLEVLRSSWRFERRPTWTRVVSALGASGDPKAVAALHGEREQLVEASLQADALRQAFDVGLALSGDAPSHERIMKAGAAGGADVAGHLYAWGLERQWAQGDPTAAERLRALFDAAPGPTTRVQVAVGTLLAEPLPEGSFLLLDHVAEAFARDNDPFHRVLAHAYALRRGGEGMASTLVDDLAALIPRVDLSGLVVVDDTLASGVIEALGALARWAR